MLYGKKSLVFLLLMMVFMYCPAQAQAWERERSHGGRGHRYHHSEHYPYGRFSVSLPNGFIEIGVRGSKYFYNTGVFYRESNQRYMVVPPPSGAVVYAIPDGWHEVIIDGTRYFVYNGVYYSRIPQGYQVVQPPMPVIVQPATVEINTADQKQAEDFKINIPDAKGGYVLVVIKRSGTGFVGPQGEYYAEFPKVAQLQAMYAHH